MHTDAPSKQKPALFQRRAHLNYSEETEFNHRNYIILLSHFSDNLNTSIANIQHCITDLEEHPKVKISRAEKQLLDCGLDYLYEMYVERLCKESYYRNAVIRKNYKVFVESYSVFAAKNNRKYYPSSKALIIKSGSQNERASQRLIFNNKQTKHHTISQKRSAKNSMLLGRSIVHQPKYSTSEEKHNLQCSKMFSVKKAPIISTHSRMLTITPSSQNKNSDSELRGGLVFINRSKYRDDEFEFDFEREVKNPVQSLCTNRVLAFRNRISTNPQQHQKDKGAKQGRMLRMSYMNIQGATTGYARAKLPYEQQIKLILNLDS